MTADIQTLTFITHQLEKLPLKDTGYGKEKLSSLFYYRGYGDENFLHRKRTRTNRISQDPENTFLSDTYYSGSVPFSLETNKLLNSNLNTKGKQVTEQESQLVVQTIRESSTNKHVTRSFTSPNKRKRSTEFSGCDCSPIAKFCDEEVRTLFRGNDVRRNVNFCGGNDELKTAWSTSNTYSSKTIKPELRKWRGRPSINVEQMQRSGFWFPFKSRGAERRVKIIKVTPCDEEKPKSNLQSYVPDIKENCLFRPINEEDEDLK